MVNILKFIGIIAVILGHINSPFSSFIFAWHMPLFFFLSGFFIDPSEAPSEYFKKSLKRLMIPYLMFGALGISIEYAKRIALHRPLTDIGTELYNFFFVMDMKALQGHYGFILWFLPALFWARSITYLVVRFIPWWYLTFLAIGVVCLIIGLNTALPFALDEALVCVIWIILGYIYKQKLGENQKIDLLLLTLALPCLAIIPRPHLDMASKFYSDIEINHIWALAFIVTLAVVVKFALKGRKVKGFINLWGRETMILFLMHPYTNNIASKFCERWSMNYWFLVLLVSLAQLYVIMKIKVRYNTTGPLKYV